MTALRSPEAVLYAARRHGLLLHPDGDKLKMKAAKEPPPALVEAVKAFKPELLRLLAAPDCPDWQIDEPHPPGPAAPLRIPPDPPAGPARAAYWAAGAARLDPMQPPVNFPAAPWRVTAESAQALSTEWGGQLAALNWDSARIFGCHHLAPWSRLDCAGLALLLRDRRVLAVHGDHVMLESVGGARLPFRMLPPSYPAETVLLWQLRAAP